MDRDQLHVPAIATVVLVGPVHGALLSSAGSLSDEGFRVVLDPSGSMADEDSAPDVNVVVIDLAVPLETVAVICASWRRRGRIPVIGMLAPGDQDGVLPAFEAGSDHVVPSGLTPRELAAHLRSVLRRAPVNTPKRPLPQNDVVLDLDRSVATIAGTVLALDEVEVRTIQLLLERDGGVVSRRELIDVRPPIATSQQAVDGLVRRLRDRFAEVDGHRRIVSVRGVGFRFVSPGTEEIDS